MARPTGYIAQFKIGYLQREIILHQCAVKGGTDKAYDNSKTGYIVGRLVNITNNSNGLPVITAATGVSATSIGNATHIIAQSDDSLRNFPGDGAATDRYTTRYRGILENTVTSDTTPSATNLEHWKSVAVYKITDSDDIKIIAL